MKFETRHHFAFPPERVWGVFFDPTYEAALSASSELDREVLETGVREGRRFRRSKLTSRKEIPPAMAAFTGPRLSYELLEVYDDPHTRLSWKVIPGAAADKVKAEGTWALVPAPGGCERVVKGEVQVRVPLVGGKIEEKIKEQLQASYDKAAVFARQWMATHLS